VALTPTPIALIRLTNSHYPCLQRQIVFLRAFHAMINTQWGFYHLWFDQGFGVLLIDLFSKKNRHSLLYNPGEAGPHEVLVTVAGKGTISIVTIIQANK
jgi:hypothetical protein